MIIDKVKILLFWIFVVVLLLGVCITVDYATNPITTTVNQSQANVSNCTIVNGVHYDNAIVKNKTIGVAKVQKVVIIKPKYPVITMTGKPSCSRCARNHCSYTWRTRTYVNYCPHCHRYNTLGNKHKWASRHEKEITCFHCDSDFCVNCGKTKYSWSNVYLRRA